PKYPPAAKDNAFLFRFIGNCGVKSFRSTPKHFYIAHFLKQVYFSTSNRCLSCKAIRTLHNRQEQAFISFYVKYAPSKNSFVVALRGIVIL
ncbi:MAG: hypothetical protein K2N60_00285, partial [Oscillospiraceae bacterium]|nr:hypothetical protein [Oscillospiraceae bacterium]